MYGNFALIIFMGIYMIEFGTLLKDYLDYYEISQSSFANRLGINKKYLKKLIDSVKLKLKNSTNIIQNAIDLFDYLRINSFDLIDKI